MTIVLTVEQRNAIRDTAFGGLSGIGDIWVKAKAGDLATAQRLSEAYADDLGLLNELGWEEEAGQRTYELTLPPDVVERVFSRYCHLAITSDANEEGEREELQRNKEINTFVIETCRRVLAELSQEREGGK